MDLTREFLEKLEEMVQPHTVTEGIRTFVDKPMHMLVDEIAAEQPLHTNTLSSVVDYIKSDADYDALACDGKMIIHVEDEKTVWLYTEMNGFKKRNRLLLATALLSSFPFGQWLSLENFIISVQANFVADEHRDDRVIREWIKQANRRLEPMGKVILSSSSWRGYWISSDPDEIAAYLQEQASRARTQAKNDEPARRLLARLRGEKIIRVRSYIRRAKVEATPDGQEKWEV